MHSSPLFENCRMPRQKNDMLIKFGLTLLFIFCRGSVSDPVIDVAPKNSEELLLQCKSEGWYPEPEVLWLDGEGNVLSAGRTETVRGPDDLYTVSSRVTVDKRHGHRFTCRVQQNNINQSRETHIYIYYSTTDSPNATSLIFRALAFGSVCIVIFVWKWG
ncbi:Butyrophilin subfamily 2 member A2 Precursor [Channa argus]|uniref:Butyrophilin subfamily 2 member A2 n=1 Tax=Channa argus TaxID=215402 RepID=A0A6G1Q6F5_CHAAH|nr:Butyrophilin subfamily 2 member A2 Precursor [Channa argus]